MAKNRSLYSKLIFLGPNHATASPALRASIVSGLDKVYYFNPKGPNEEDENGILNLKDTKELFKTVSSPKLIKSNLFLKMASMKRMVGLGTRVMNSTMMDNPITRMMVLMSIRHTFYNHFCGGEALRDAMQTCEKLQGSGLRAMLDYGLEHAVDDGSCDLNLDGFIQTIQLAKTPKGTPPISSVVVKITALCPPTLLKRVSDLLRWEYKDKSLHLPWKLQSFPIFCNSSAFYHTLRRPEPLTLAEERNLDLAHARLNKICETSLDANVPLLIDAEDTTIQPAIDYLAYTAAIKYRRVDGPLIFNTVQAYLKDALERLVLAKKAADNLGVQVGFKLVRGAYLSSERELASSLGFQSPIHDGIDATHRCYDECTAFMLQEIAKGAGSVVLATHNVNSGQEAATRAVDLGIKKDNPNLHFAQLYGMADSLSFGLKNAGFKVSKYLPFGPVEHIIPYLLRRAEENTDLISSSSFDRKLMEVELRRRLAEYIGLENDKDRDNIDNWNLKFLNNSHLPTNLLTISTGS